MGENVGQHVGGRYHVLEQLGRGGMGEVYRVRDQRSGRELACKRLLTAAKDDKVAAQLFEREFHTLSELAHPRIIEVYDYGVDEHGAYYTMELLGGQDLRALGKLDWRTACALLRDVASSLAILHSRRLLHGDLSPRNVRCTADGRAKLIDFGAMMPMGVTKRVVGTPPFIPPEMVQLQALDGRADLFALGALAYYALTGRHAYPARAIAELRDVWGRPPRPVAELEPEVPGALSELVMELLQLNRNARPRSAGIVMERLCAIASLPLAEHDDVAEAYLTTPTLVGRDEPLAAVRNHFVQAMRERGRVLLVQGPPGSGRSRFLDACVLEAKLLGAHVLRADAGDAGRGNYGVARALCEQLFEVAPEVARRAARLHAPVLAHVLGEELVSARAAGERPNRRKLLAALRDFVFAAVRALRLVIAVDDVERIDEASASLLVALAHKTRRRKLCVLLAMDAEGQGSAALDFLAQDAEPIALRPLHEDETERLLRSVFGDTKHLLTLARRIHGIAHGNPRAIMQLATHLVERGVARYEAGSFILPERLHDDDLPPSLTATFERRIAALEPDALELARALALTDPSELPTACYAELTSHGDRGRTYRAVDQLVRAQLLELEGDRYRLSDAAVRAVLRDGTVPELRRELHARLARAFEQDGSNGRRAYHLMESEQPEAAIRLLLTQFLKDPNEPRDPLEDSVPGMLDVLERASAAADALRMPAPLRIELRMKTLGASQFIGDLPRFQRLAPSTLEQLERDAGLVDYRALDPNMEPMARLTEALTRAQARYEATPEAERGLPPVDAIRELARLCAIYAGMGAVAQDLDILERAPSLAPLAPLSPAVAAIQTFADAALAGLQGRLMRVRQLLSALLERLDAPDRAGLGELYHTSLRLGSLYILGLTEAGLGLPNAGARVAELERAPGHRVNAQRVHSVCKLMQGESEEAAAAQRRAELVMLQDGQQQRYPNTSARAEMIAYWLADDLPGMKQVTERVARAASVFPRWMVLAHVGRAQCRRMQGDARGALSELEPALAQVKALRHTEWGWIVASQVQALTEIGRADEAVTLGLEQFELCRREGVDPGQRRIGHAIVQALIAAGRGQQAAELADSLIAETLETGARGLLLGSLYEMRARAALALDDAAGFAANAALCAQEYRPTDNPLLAAKYERLLRDAKRHGIDGGLQTAQAPSASPTSAATLIAQRLAKCTTAEARARGVIEILSEYAPLEQAFLYGAREGRPELLYSLASAPEPDGLAHAIARILAQELELESATALAQPEPADTLASLPSAASLRDTSGSTLLGEDPGRALRPLVLATRHEGQTVIAGIAALGFGGLWRRMPPAPVLEALAAALLEHDDVDPVTCLA